MLNMRSLLKFFDTAYVFKIFMIGLLLSLIPIGEIILLVYLINITGIYFILALLMSTSLIGFIFIFPQIKKLIIRVKRQAVEGYYPKKDFNDFFGAILSGILLIFPGFITFILGFLFLFRQSEN